MIYEIGFATAFGTICVAPLMYGFMTCMADVLANHQARLREQVLQSLIAI